ncbi:GAF domain-containing protein [Aliikangiella marina]|uniref:GAF domain-containing protein n=1 Tax=Aliikangiella marina TaxID=1712262 RepID=A0A545T4B6_9GAMM|nr:CHASE domain-containing protein [Aliikangiella marina]TQV72022.1 GAF domain-containing protein [Aliikangiella marina]
MDPKLTRGYLPVVLVLLLGVGFTVTLTWSLLDRESRFQLNQFEKDATLYADAVEKALERRSNVVSDLANYFYLNENLSRKAFSQIAQTYLARDLSIQALEWIPLVRKADRSAFELQAKKDYPNFQFTDKDPQGNIIRAGERDVYFPVYYVEPYLGNESALGYSSIGSSIRNEMINRAIKTASPVASSRVDLLQVPEFQSGLFVFTPVFHNKLTQSLTQLDLGNLKGFTLGVFKLSSITSRALEQQKHLPLNLLLFNSSHASADSFLYGHDSKGRHQFEFESNMLETRSLIYQHDFNLMGRHWQVIIKPEAGKYSALSLNLMFVFMFGLGISIYVAWLVSRVRKKQIAEAELLSQEMTTAQLILNNKDTTLMRQNNALTHLTQSINQFSESLSESLEDITETASVTLNAGSVSAWFFNDDKKIIQCFDYYDLTNKEHLSGFEMHAENYPLFFNAILNGEVIVADDVLKDSRTRELEDDYITRFDTKSLLSVPLRYQGKIVGVVSVSQNKTNRAWSIEEIHFTNSIASFIALAVESVRRHQAELQLKQSSDRLALINAIANGIRSCFSPQSVIRYALKLLFDEFPDYRVSYAKVSKLGVVTVIECLSPSFMKNVKGAKIDLKVVPDFLIRLLKQEPVILSDLLGDARLDNLKDTIIQSNTRALLSYSLSRFHDQVDFLMLESHASHHWGEHEILTIKEVTEYLELALRDARGQEARKRAEKALDSQKAKLEYLVEERTAELRHKSDLEEVVANLSTKFINLPVDEYDEVIYNALQSIGSLCRAERANLNEVKSDELTVIKSHEWLAPGISSSVAKNSEFKLNRLPWIYRRLKKRNIVYFDSPEMMPKSAEKDQSSLTAMGAKSFISIPIVYGLKLCTIFNLSTQNYEAKWTPDEITLLQLVGNMLTNVIQRRRYEEQLKRSENLLRKSNKNLMAIIAP